MRPWLTLSAMYSKCIVPPLMSTPTAMTASYFPVAIWVWHANGSSYDPGTGRMVRFSGLTLNFPRRSPFAPSTRLMTIGRFHRVWTGGVDGPEEEERRVGSRHPFRRRGTHESESAAKT